MNLVLILLALFIALFLLVKVGERFMKPMSPETSSRLSGIIIFLVLALLIVRIIEHYF